MPKIGRAESRFAPEPATYGFHIRRSQVDKPNDSIDLRQPDFPVCIVACIIPIFAKIRFAYGDSFRRAGLFNIDTGTGILDFSAFPKSLSGSGLRHAKTQRPIMSIM